VRRKSKQVLKWEISGIFFLIIVGSLLHFLFDWSYQHPIVGVVSAVNESVWEHLKLGYWSLVMFSLLEYHFIKRATNNFFLAKGLGILILQGIILLVYYTYSTLWGEPTVVIDIAAYILGCILCQVVSYRILTRTRKSRVLNRLGLGILLIHAALLIVFTFIPPMLPIFQDSHTLSYGIDW